MASSFSQFKMDTAALQQFSQFMFLQSLVSSGMNPSMAMPSQFQQQLQQMPTLSMPSSKMPTQIPSMPLSPTSDQSNIEALEAVSKLLSAHQNLKSQMPSSGFPLQMPSFNSNNNFRLSPYQQYQQQQKQPEYRIAVTRESAKPLQEWMNQNIHHPYPTSSDIQSLSKQTGFTHKQIRNWFTNNRRRFELQLINQSLPWNKKQASNRKSSSEASSEGQKSPTPELSYSSICDILNLSTTSEILKSPKSEEN